PCGLDTRWSSHRPPRRSGAPRLATPRSPMAHLPKPRKLSVATTSSRPTISTRRSRWPVKCRHRLGALKFDRCARWGDRPMMHAEAEAAVAEAHRREWGYVLAAALRVTGDIDLAEECVQDAYARALATWSEQGQPAKPAAWLTTVA